MQEQLDNLLEQAAKETDVQGFSDDFADRVVDALHGSLEEMEAPIPQDIFDEIGEEYGDQFGDFMSYLGGEEDAFEGTAESVNEVTEALKAHRQEQLDQISTIQERIGALDTEIAAEERQALATQESTVAESSKTLAMKEGATAALENTIAQENLSLAERAQIKAAYESVIAENSEKVATSANSIELLKNVAARMEEITQAKLQAGSIDADAAALENERAAIIRNTAAQMENGEASLTAFQKIGQGIKGLLKGAAMMFVIQAGIWVISKIVEAIDAKIHEEERKLEEIKNKAEEAQKVIDDITSDIDKKKSSVKDLAEEYAELAQGVKDLGKATQSQGTLSTSEYERFQEISEQLVELFPQLYGGMDSTGNAMTNLSGDTQTIVSSLEDLLKAEQDLANFKIAQEMPNVLSQQLVEYKEALDSLKTKRDKISSEESVKAIAEEYKNYKYIYTPGDADWEALAEIIEYYGWDGLRIVRNKETGKIEEGDINLSNAPSDYLWKIHKYFTTMVSQYDKEAQAAQFKVDDIKRRFSQNLLVTIKGTSLYQDNPELQGMFSAIAQSIDIDRILADGIDISNSSQVEGWIYQNIVSPMSTIPDEVAKSFQDIDLDTPYSEIQAFINQILTLPGFDKEHPLVVYVQEVADNRQKREQDVTYKITDGATNSARQVGNQFESWVSNLTDEEITLILNADASPANQSIHELNRWLLSLIKQSEEEATASISDAVNQLNTEIKPQFDALATAYDQVFHNEGGFEAGLESLDIAWFEGIRSSFLELEEESGIVFDKEKVNEFFDALENGEEVTEELAHEAFNELASAYFYSAEGLQNLNDETEASIKQMMEQAGVTNADEVIDNYKKWQNALADVKEEIEGLDEVELTLYEQGYNLETLTQEQIQELERQGLVTDEVRDKLQQYVAMKQLINGTLIDTDQPIQALAALARQADLTGAEMQELNTILGLFGRAKDLETNGAYAAANAVRVAARARELAFAQILQTKYNEELKIDFDVKPSDTGSGGGGGGSDKDEKTEAEKLEEEFDKAYERLQWLRDNDLIDEKEYLDQLNLLINDMLRDADDAAKLYIEKIHDYLNELLEYYNSVLSDIQNLIEEEKDKVEKEKDEKLKAIEEEKDARLKQIEDEKKAALEANEAEEKALEGRIKKKQEEVDQIKKANEARQAEIDLQKKQYELMRAQYQRTNLVYKEGYANGGQLIYQADPNAIREKQQDVDDAIEERRISKMEEEIELLEKQKDKISEKGQELEDYYDKLNDEAEEHYKNLTEETEKYYDTIIKKYEEQLEKWKEIAEMQEKVDRNSRLASLGIIPENVLNGDEETYNNFKDNYVGILADLYRESEEKLAELAELYNNGVTDTPSYLGKMQEELNNLSRIDLSSTEAAFNSLDQGIQTLQDNLYGIDTSGAIWGFGDLKWAAEEALTDIGDAASGAGGAFEDIGEKASKSFETTATKAEEAANNIHKITDAIGSGMKRKKATPAVPTNVPVYNELYDENGNSLVSVLDGVYSVGETAFDTLRDGANDAIQPVSTLAGETHKLADGLGDVAKGIDDITEAAEKSKQKGVYVTIAPSSLPKAHADGTVGPAFASGTGYNGLSSAEQGALRSEYGQPELTVYPNGTYELTTTPTISDLPKDTVIFNERQTKKILKNSGMQGKAHATGTNETLLPLAEAMPHKAEIFRRFEVNLEENISRINANVADMTLGMRDIAQNITNIANNSNVGNNVTFGAINVTCPGVTEAEVAKNIGGALRNELSGMFTGFALRADQKAMRR